MVVRWRYADLWSDRECLCNERVVYIQYVAIDDLVITTPLKKRYSRPLVMLW